MLDLIIRINARYSRKEITATQAYHAVCLMVEVFANELREWQA